MAGKRQFLMADFSEAGAALGAIQGMTMEVNTNKFASDVVGFVHGELATAFDFHMDAIAASAPESFHHVYEWNLTGVPRARLWKHRMIGFGAERNATWDWVASKTPIPKPMERMDNPNDPMSALPVDEVREFSNRTYFFYWKAPVMELGRPVSIMPKHGKAIAFPVFSDDGADVIFSRGLSVLNPGGDEVKGKFSAAWTTWWATEAPRLFETEIGRAIGSETGDVTQNSIRTAKRRSRKQLTLNAMTSYEDAFAIGEDWSRAQLRRTSNAYKRRTKK